MQLWLFWSFVSVELPKKPGGHLYGKSTLTKGGLSEMTRPPKRSKSQLACEWWRSRIVFSETYESVDDEEAAYDAVEEHVKAYGTKVAMGRGRTTITALVDQ